MTDVTARTEAEFTARASKFSVPKLISLLESPHAYKRAISVAELDNLVSDADSGVDVAKQVFKDASVSLLQILAAPGYEIVRENACRSGLGFAY